MQIVHQMTMDMALPLPVVPVAAVQGDGNTRILSVTLLENGAPWQIPEEAVVDVAFRKPDGTKGIYSKLPDGSNATSRDGNMLSATLAPQMLTCPGPVQATVVFRVDGAKTLAAFPFTVMVEANPAAGAEISEDYFNPTQISDLRAELAAGLATKAPAGYGLGSAELISVDKIDSTTKPGFYCISGTMLLNNVRANYWYMFVSGYSSGTQHCMQKIYPITTYKVELVRFLQSGNWGEWECSNPPMIAGTEYRTTERYGGKAVYTKLVEFGALPNAATGYANGAFPVGADVISISGYGESNGEVQPLTTLCKEVWSNKTAGYIGVLTSEDRSGFSAIAILKYTKWSDRWQK